VLAEILIRAACGSCGRKPDVGGEDERISTGEPCHFQNTADGRCDGKGESVQGGMAEMVRTRRVLKTARV
jgi:hypothetical protein